MATSSYPTRQYTSSQFVEIAGAILFRPATNQVCLIHYLSKNEWLLPEGRGNLGERRHDAALRETGGETGYLCDLYPLCMAARAPPPDDTGHVQDVPRWHPNTTDPFMVTIRDLSGGDNIKLIFWYVAQVDEEALDGAGCGVLAFRARFFGYEEAVQRLTFQEDREVLQTAIATDDNSGAQAYTSTRSRLCSKLPGLLRKWRWWRGLLRSWRGLSNVYAKLVNTRDPGLPCV
jgi:8-oxo-dGTP pyrophosphatase MutT (NUDIX family)